MPTAFAAEAARIHRVGVSSEAIATATGASSSTVRSWITGRTSPTTVRGERVAELASIVERLMLVMSPEYVPVWLVKPVPALDNEKPVDLIGRGEFKAVSKIVASLEAPGAA